MSADEHLYNFFDDYEDTHGIFRDRDDPVGSYGDLDAVADLNAEDHVEKLVMGRGADGLPQVVPQFDVMAVLGASACVTDMEMVCLAGPCKHYVECVIQNDGYQTVERYCTRLCSWAEPLRLDDAYIHACSAHEPKSDVVAGDLATRLKLNKLMVLNRNIEAEQTIGHSLGVCYEGHCKHYVLMLVGVLNTEGEVEIGPRRYCARLAGAARLKKLDPWQPVIGCSAIEPSIPIDVLARNEQVLENRRQQDVERWRESDGDNDDGLGREQD